MAGSSSSRFVIYGAILANFGIAVAKFVAAGVSGSSAMLAEGIHSVVDTGNGLLMLLGVSMSQRPPNDTHPYGHGADLYFWALVVGVMIFGVGGGVTIYEGILHIINPAPTRGSTWNYVVLGIAFLGAASIVIGVLLCGVATLLIRETRGLLLGEAADPETVESIHAIVAGEPAILHARHPLTMHLGPQQVLLNLDLQFRPDLTASEVEQAIDRLEQSIREKHPEVRHIFIEAENLSNAKTAGSPGLD